MAQRTEQEMPRATRDFSIYGLRVRSDIDLPGWPTAEAGHPDVHVRLEPFDAPSFDAAPYMARQTVKDGEVGLEVRGVGRYRATNGSLIRLAVESGAKGEDVRLYLTGAVMGAILHQRGIFTLHASCVTLNGNGIAFAGKSGEGKSTLVAAMVRHGATFVSDDICVMAPSASGEPHVWPGAARVKLDEIGLSALPEAGATLEPAGGNRGKYHLPVGATDSMEPVPLRKVYLLATSECSPRVERLTGLDAISALVDETYFLTYGVALGQSPRIFRMAAEITRTVQVSRLIRPRGLEHFPAVLDLIEQDA